MSAASDHDDHAETHDDEHGHGAEPLGPIDTRAWGAAIVGAISAMLVVGVLFIAMNPS